MRVAVTNDNIVEGDETFSMSLNIPSSLAPRIITGLVHSATGIIIDSSGKINSYLVTSCFKINDSYQSEVYTNTIHWFRSHKICDSNIGISKWTIQ